MKINKDSFFWNYLSSEQKGLIEEGFYLLKNAQKNKDVGITDYSYLVFPFAKAYEGFLKKVFLDLNFISKKEFESKRFRIGKALNPHLEKKLRKLSVYDKITYRCQGEELASKLWSAWKKGRNQVFHYFPHNIKALNLNEAEDLINNFIEVMQEAVILCKVDEVFLRN